MARAVSYLCFRWVAGNFGRQRKKKSCETKCHGQNLISWLLLCYFVLDTPMLRIAEMCIPLLVLISLGKRVALLPRGLSSAMLFLYFLNTFFSFSFKRRKRGRRKLTPLSAQTVNVDLPCRTVFFFLVFSVAMFVVFWNVFITSQG